MSATNVVPNWFEMSPSSHVQHAHLLKKDRHVDASRIITGRIPQTFGLFEGLDLMNDLLGTLSAQPENLHTELVT